MSQSPSKKPRIESNTKRGKQPPLKQTQREMSSVETLNRRHAELLRADIERRSQAIQQLFNPNP
ncbi:hypothetical protein PROFUN_00972 [Planoprotostelium fungivorum]|uniref:Uncharacterized protein n=1 Tax=Planoprotostelium fungivorum TaxID=1890364 RepID=A0A2P6N4B3_9EUKA|nr:hypothetical protein PROFUN_00972 [Planoprotostelium fungivorum]